MISLKNKTRNIMKGVRQERKKTIKNVRQNKIFYWNVKDSKKKKSDKFIGIITWPIKHCIKPSKNISIIDIHIKINIFCWANNNIHGKYSLGTVEMLKWSCDPDHENHVTCERYNRECFGNKRKNGYRP